MPTKDLFERELQNRGIAFTIDAETGRHSLEIGGGTMLISIANLERDIATDGDVGRIGRFVDAIVAAADEAGITYAIDGLYWSLESNDYDEPPDFRVPISGRLDRVLIHQSSDGQLLSWVSPRMLEELKIDENQAAAIAFDNLARALAEAKIEYSDIDGTRLGFVNTALQFKASLILAPNLQEAAGRVLGWPLLAVVPDRDFLYLWDARNKDFTGRVGSVVVREYSQAAYPLSTEVYEIVDGGVRAIGAFPTEDS